RWHSPPSLPAVQGLLMRECERIFGGAVKIVGASRTDAGVHALRQVASLTTPSAIPAAALARALNALLPLAVRVTDVGEAPAGFDARRSALGKRYAYLIDRGIPPDPCLRPFRRPRPVP